MTREEASKNLLLDWYVDRGCEFKIRPGRLDDFLAAIDVALAALRHQIWEDQLWHDAKTDPPKTPGLYYGKKDDTNSMYACQYRDGVWVLDMYPQQKMEIVQWADYTAFARENEETALRPVSREQVEKVWRGEWVIGEPDVLGVPIHCSRCGWGSDHADQRKWMEYNGHLFCGHCGAPMTDKAVDMVMERLEALKDGKDD